MSRRFSLQSAYANPILVGAVVFNLAVQTALTTMSILVLVPTEARADLPEVDDLLGRWCQSDGPSYTFARQSLEVRWPDGGKRSLQIVKMQTEENGLKIYWSFQKKKDGTDDATVYEISADKRLLTQRANVGGDNGPRREFRRC